MPVDHVNIYRWLYTNTAPSGAVSQHCKGPYLKKQNVNHLVPRSYHVKAELQQISFGYDEHGHEELQWVTVKTLELSNNV